MSNKVPKTILANWAVRLQTGIFTDLFGRAAQQSKKMYLEMVVLGTKGFPPLPPQYTKETMMLCIRSQ